MKTRNKYITNKILLLIKTFLCLLLFMPFISYAMEEGASLNKQKWPFDGFFGKFDVPSVQRGYQVYKEVCSTCHSAKRVYYRNLTDIGFSKEEVKAIASEYAVTDGPDEKGNMFKRAAFPSDSFVSPYENENLAKLANGGAVPPDLSLIVKARENGPDYVFSLLTGYVNPPENFSVEEGLNYNPYFPTQQLRMPAPLSSGLVEYSDGTEATLEQMAYDVVNFLQWIAEPEMQKRKRTGIIVFGYLFVITVLFYIAKKRIWSRLEK